MLLGHGHKDWYQWWLKNRLFYSCVLGAGAK